MFCRLALAVTLAIPLAAAGVAHADDAAKQALINQLTSFDFAVADFTKDDGGIHAAPKFHAAPAVCTETVAKLQALGVGPTETIFGATQWLFRKAPEKCERYAAVHALTRAFPQVQEALQKHMIMAGLPAGDQGATMWAGEAAKAGQACAAALDDAAAKGADMELVFPVAFNDKRSGAQLRTWCGELAGLARAKEQKSADADAEKKKRARERYTRHGAAGDRLEWLLYYDADGRGRIWHLKGCKTSEDPKVLARAPVLISWFIHPDGTHALRKLTFKGNKLVSDKEQMFDTRAKASRYCK